jgi:hypothetical protein
MERIFCEGFRTLKPLDVPWHDLVGATSRTRQQFNASVGVRAKGGRRGGADG